jgi:type III secretion protein R
MGSISNFDPFSLLTIFAAISIVPLLAMVTTSYTKLVVVMSLLRMALGLQQTPPNMVLNGLALILTAYIMAPIGFEGWRVYNEDSMGSGRPAAMGPAEVGRLALATSVPMKKFLVKFTHQKELKFFLRTAKALWPAEQAAKLKPDDLIILIPAFTISQLTEAFTIGFVLYICFVVIDLIVANILLAMGMSMLSPTTVSTPFKLLLFVVLDGWSLLIHNLVLSYK